jgi:hypothetical protein
VLLPSTKSAWIKKYPDYILNGMITVANQPPLSSSPPFSPSSSNSNNIDTIAAFMVPLNQQDRLISEFQSRGFGIDSTYALKSVRGDGTEGCGDTQESLLVLTSSGKNLNAVISALHDVAPTMPCT